MTTTHDDKAREREQFEAWIATRPGHPFAGQFANLMWAAWQARAALSPASSTGQEAVWEEICERSAGAVLNGKKGLIILEDDLVRIGEFFAAPAEAEIRDKALEEAAKVCARQKLFKTADDIRALKSAAGSNNGEK